MRLIIIYFAALALAFAACIVARAEEDSTDANSAAPPQTVTFDGQTLHLAWQGGEPGAPIYEYVPQGETLDKWTHLASIREWHDIADWKTLAGNTVRMVKQTYPGAPTQTVENPTTGETIVDFLVGPEDNSFVEYNVFKYAKRDGGGTVAQQYAIRSYGNTEQFLKDLPEVRSRLLDEMAATGLEAK
jgi:hypothetical protein